MLGVYSGTVNWEETVPKPKPKKRPVRRAPLAALEGEEFIESLVEEIRNRVRKQAAKPPKDARAACDAEIQAVLAKYGFDLGIAIMPAEPK